MIKNSINVKNLIICTGLLFLVGCTYIPKSIDFTKPIKVTSLSDVAWVVDIGKSMDRHSRFNLSRIEAAKEAQKKGCDYFKSDISLNKQLDPYKGQRAYRCASEDSQPAFVTEEVLRLETL